jgi:hypothetical protein
MDEADAADATVEQHLKRALARRNATLPAVGTCYSCAEPVDGARRFCDRECLEDWERMETGRRRREGGK